MPRTSDYAFTAREVVQLPPAAIAALKKQLKGTKPVSDAEAHDSLRAMSRSVVTRMRRRQARREVAGIQAVAQKAIARYEQSGLHDFDIEVAIAEYQEALRAMEAG